MTTSRRPVDPVPITPSHRRTWRSLWQRCSCGLTAPCVDRLTSPSPLVEPPRTSAPTQSRPPARVPAPARPPAPAPDPARPPAPAPAPAARPHAPAPARRPVPAPASASAWLPGQVPAALPQGPPFRAARPVPPVLRTPAAAQDWRASFPVRWARVPAAPDRRLRGAQAGRAGSLTPAQMHRTAAVAGRGRRTYSDGDGGGRTVSVGPRWSVGDGS
jgi:hypothetical protein